MFKNDYFKQKKIENNNQVNNPLNGLFENIFFVYVFLLAIFNSAFAGDEEITDQSIRRSRLEDRADIARKLLKKCSALQSRVSDLESRSENTVINVGEITKTMLERVGKGLTEGGPFDSPVKKANRGQPGTPGNANILREIQKITIEIDSADKRPVEVIENVRAEVVSQLALVFTQYVERKQKSGSTDEGLSLVVRNGDSPVRTLEVSVDSIVHAFRLAAARVLDPNLAQLLIDCQLQVVLPTIHQPAPQMLDLKKEGARYVQKIKKAIQNEGDLYDLVQQYRPDYAVPNNPEDDAMPNRRDKHAMLILMLGHNIESVATGFQASRDATTMIEMGEELRDNFYDAALLTFIHYISGNTNKRQVREIIALTNGGRGQSISEQSLYLLNQELTQIFYPRRESGSLTVTRYEFGRPSSNVSGARAPNTILATSMDVLGFVFGNCLAPARQNLLTDGGNHSARSSSTPAIEDSKEEI
ncbi:MAG: hypothetical protein KBD04_05445 [Proteobacteria bacterium]|nr:hypothetical protein [Pseudomonadota bacterium]